MAIECMLAPGAETRTEILDGELKQAAKLRRARDILLYILIGSGILIRRIIIGARSAHPVSPKPATHQQNPPTPDEWPFPAPGVIIGALPAREDRPPYAPRHDVTGSTPR